MLLLSGGEKALTALALLVGICKYAPSPFCVLDEVDAPLDETNVGRLAEMIKTMSSETQFLLVTHSKRMMTAADLIYGVTMQEPGVSNSVRCAWREKKLHPAAPANEFRSVAWPWRSALETILLHLFLYGKVHTRSDRPPLLVIPTVAEWRDLSGFSHTLLRPREQLISELKSQKDDNV